MPLSLLLCVFGCDRDMLSLHLLHSSTISQKRNMAIFIFQQKRNGCPNLPSTPPLVSLHNSNSRSVDHDDMSYARVHEFRQPPLTSTPRVRLLQPPDEGLVRFGSHKYENVLRTDLHVGTVSYERDTWYAFS